MKKLFLLLLLFTNILYAQNTEFTVLITAELYMGDNNNIETVQIEPELDTFIITNKHIIIDDIKLNIYKEYIENNCLLSLSTNTSNETFLMAICEDNTGMFINIDNNIGHYFKIVKFIEK